MMERSLDLMHMYKNSQLHFNLVNVVEKHKTLSKRLFVVQHHKLIINKFKFDHDHHSKKKLKISKHFYNNIFLSCKPTMY